MSGTHWDVLCAGNVLKLLSEAHHLLTIPELLLQIFNIIESELPNGSDLTNKKIASRTLANCALVCRAWEEVATECLWRDLPSALCLLEVLGPLTYRKDVGNEGWDFAAPIADSNRIRRFLRLANCVHTLTHRTEARWTNATSSIVSHSAIQSIIPAISQNSDPMKGTFLCPRLRELRWISHLKHDHSLLQYLTPPSLRNFDLWPIVTMLYDMTWDDVDSAFGAAMRSVVAGGCSEVEAFQFLSDNRRPTPSLTKLLAQFLSRQTRLSKVDIFTSLTKDITTALARSSQSIRLLTCHLSPEETGVSISEAMKLIALSCSTLEGLTAFIDAEDFSVSDLKGLFNCKTLRKLCIHYWSLSSPLVAKDVEAMAASWPSLKMLHLLTSNPFPRPHTPLSILTTIAQCMESTLTDLGLELFADETVQLTTSLEAGGFTDLRHLIIGISSTVKEGYEPHVADYLASICPHSVEISMRSRSILGLPDGSLDPWSKVGAFFKHSCSGARGMAPRNRNCGSSVV